MSGLGTMSGPDKFNLQIMKKRILFYLAISIFVLSNIVVYAQDSTWVRIFGEDEHTATRSLFETYDHGYMISAFTIPPNPPGGLIKDGLLIKTDINGNKLWQKTIGGGVDDKIGGIKAYPTFDGGTIMVGGTYNYGSLSSVFIMKLNACGERD